MSPTNQKKEDIEPIGIGIGTFIIFVLMVIMAAIGAAALIQTSGVLTQKSEVHPFVDPIVNYEPDQIDYIIVKDEHNISIFQILSAIGILVSIIFSILMLIYGSGKGEAIIKEKIHSIVKNRKN